MFSEFLYQFPGSVRQRFAQQHDSLSGDQIGTVETANASESSLTEMMVGKKVELNIERPEPVVFAPTPVAAGR